MLRFLFPLALIATPAAVQAQTPTPAPTPTHGQARPEIEQADPQLTLEQRAMMRCSAAFAITAFRQDNGDAAALRFPDMSARGQEFFVRAIARLMDETGLNRSEVEALLSSEARRIAGEGDLAQVVRPCLSLLPD